ncbi:MAG: TauD/TfdA family dioxygenase [Magnetovibrio sp.]|nr:TauD/TfdA family dioxygenase [Magnetovibrio sp.]
MREILREPVNEATVWKADRFRGDDSWIFDFTDAHVREIDAALNRLRGSGAGPAGFGRDDFPLDTLAEGLAGQLEELERGRGFSLMRGLPAERYDLDELTAIYWGIGTHLGEGIYQNAQGDLVGHVTDHGNKFEGDDPYKYNIRAYTTTVSIPPHTDSCDLVGLLCVRPAKSGGESAVVSSTALYNEFLATRPDLLEPLYEGFYLDLIGKGTKEKELSHHPIPVFSYWDGKLSCRYNKGQIEHGAKKKQGGLTPLQQEAVDYFRELSVREDLRLEMEFRAGDIQILNNRTTLHSRTGFEDHPEPDRRRLLLRLWLNSFTPRPMAPEFANQLNTGARGAVTVRA